MTGNIATVIGFNLNPELTSYANGLQTATMYSEHRQYPVAQSKAWAGDAKGIYNNFYAMINFIKFMWMKVKLNKYDIGNQCLKKPILQRFLIELFQQKFFSFIQIIRGDRYDSPKPYLNDEVNDRIGISSINIPSLKRRIRGKPNYKVEPWLHPGRKCNVKYRGKYGEKMIKYTEENNFFGSVQCGISASTQYILFMYLLSTTANVRKTTDEIRRDLRNLITTECLYLAGDGGHNIREILYGLTSTFIILHVLATEVNNELEMIFHKGSLQSNFKRAINSQHADWRGPILKMINNFISKEMGKICPSQRSSFSDDDRWEIFKEMLRVLSVWEPIISEFYKFTSNINIVGVYTSDIIGHYNISNVKIDVYMLL